MGLMLCTVVVGGLLTGGAVSVADDWTDVGGDEIPLTEDTGEAVVEPIELLLAAVGTPAVEPELLVPVVVAPEDAELAAEFSVLADATLVGEEVPVVIAAPEAPDDVLVADDEPSDDADDPVAAEDTPDAAEEVTVAEALEGTEE